MAFISHLSYVCYVFQILNIMTHQLQSYLVGALELLQIKIKVPGQSTHSEERSQQERLVCYQCRAVRILLMLNLQLVKCA